VLGGAVVASELAYLLVRLDKKYTERSSDERWEDYYARELERHGHPIGAAQHMDRASESRFS
jgi:hypothetical protein